MRTALAILAALSLAGCETSGGGQDMRASWYGTTGNKTASGEHYRQDGLTAAHKTLPFGTVLRVTYDGRTAECRVNDRGPFIKGRDVDLSRGCARAVGLTGVGVDQVRVQVLPR